MRNLSDKQLIKRYLNGDKRAFGVLVNRYKDFIYNLALRLTGKSTEAEDLVQEIFIRTMDKIDSFRGEAKFSTWLYRLAANLCYDWIRRGHPDNLPIDENQPATENTVENVEARDLQNQVRQALAQLPPDYRLIVILRDIQGLSYKEIADSLGLSL